MSTRALEVHLAPLASFLKEPAVTDVVINRPGELYVGKGNHFERHAIPALSITKLETLAYLVAEFNQQILSHEKPLLAASLPQGERIQWVMPPACEKDNIICAIRKPQWRDMQLEDYQQAGAFDVPDRYPQKEGEQALISYYQEKNYLAFLTLAIRLKKNIVISAGTGVGKTTFLNACLKVIPMTERLVTLEDTREVKVKQPNVVHLLASKGNQSVTHITMQDLFECSLRLRPDRILLSEIRGAEAFAFLRAINSGHPGSMSTIHADSPKACFEQLVFMMQQAGTTFSPAQLLKYIQSTIPIVVQLQRGTSPERFMYVSDIYFKPLAD